MRRDRTVGSMTALTNEESSGRSPSPFRLEAPAWPPRFGSHVDRQKDRVDRADSWPTREAIPG